MPKKSQTLKKMKGGLGAAEHAIQVYGPSHAQHAVSGSNVIAMNEVKGGKLNVLMPAVVGGAKNGGNILTDIAVPASLMVVNQVYKKKGGKKQLKSKKNQRSVKNRTRSYRKK